MLTRNLKIRAQLMHELSAYIEDQGLTQVEASALFGVTQPRISDPVRGKIDRFTIDMLARAGQRLDVKVSGQAA